MNTLNLKEMGLDLLTQNEMIENEGALHPMGVAWCIILAMDSFVFGFNLGNSKN